MKTLTVPKKEEPWKLNFEEASEIVGMCGICAEYTSLIGTCCDSGVLYKGSWWTIDDLSEAAYNEAVEKRLI